MKIKPIYHKYTDWEDFKNGMYSNKEIPSNTHQSLVNKSESLLKDEYIFLRNGLNMITDWVISSEENLTKTQTNRRAWIGQATCCYCHKASEIITKEAWNNLSFIEKTKANNAADLIIKEYERRYREVHQNMGKSML